MCCTTLFSAGTTAAAAGTDGTYQEQAQTESQSKKSEEELIQEIEADPELALTIIQGDVFKIKTDFTGLKLEEGEKAELKKAAMEDGTEFDANMPGTYKCVYKVTPEQGEADSETSAQTEQEPGTEPASLGKLLADLTEELFPAKTEEAEHVTENAISRYEFRLRKNDELEQKKAI